MPREKKNNRCFLSAADVNRHFVGLPLFDIEIPHRKRWQNVVIHFYFIFLQIFNSMHPQPQSHSQTKLDDF